MQKVLCYLFLIPTFYFPFSVAAQQKISIVRDTTYEVIIATVPYVKHKEKLGVILSTGEIVKEGTLLKVGKGSLPNGDFNFIATRSNTSDAKLKANTDRTWMRISDIKKKVNNRSNKVYGYHYTFYLEDRYLIDLENAILTGEIILENP